MSGDFLLEISKHILMFELHKYSADIDLNGQPSFEDHPFYGIPSHFWRAISRQMLGNGLHHFKLSDGKDCWVGCDLHLHFIDKARNLNAVALFQIERIRPDCSLPAAQVKVRLDKSF